MPGRGNPLVNSGTRIPPIVSKQIHRGVHDQRPMNFSGSSAKSVTTTPPPASTGTGISFNLGGGGGILGGLFGLGQTRRTNIANAQQAERQMQFQREANQKAMDFSERMSSTAIQRRMADLRAAGLNPILAGKYDASSPSGATSGGAMAKMENPTQSTIAGATAKAQLNNLRANNKLIMAQVAQTDQNTAQSSANTLAALATLENKKLDALIPSLVNTFLSKFGIGL